MSANTMMCLENGNLQEYLEGNLTTSEKLRLDRHVRECPSCAARLASYKRLFSQLDTTFAPSIADRPSLGRVEGVMTRISAGKTADKNRLRDNQLSPSHSGLEAFLNALFRLWKPLAVGSICAILLFSVYPFRSPTGVEQLIPSGSRENITPETETTSTNGFSFSYSIQGQSGARLRRIDTAFVQAPPDATVIVKYENVVNRLEFSRQARFSLTGSGARLLEGTVLCDLNSVPNGFSVTTPSGSITVHGTRFQVSIFPGGTEVRLDKGSVLLRTSRNTELLDHPGIRVMTGEGGIVSTGGSPVEPTSANPDSTIITPLNPPSASVSIPVQNNPDQSAQNMHQGY
ncbi:MAG: FecR domain-containing protein [Candidatus Ozemobacteraceae bacterium]